MTAIQGTTNFDYVTATTFTGNLTGNVTGNATGTHGGTFTGQSAGTFTGQGAGTFTGPVTGDLTGFQVCTPQEITTAGTITNAVPVVLINSTTARAIKWTLPSKLGSLIEIHCIAAPSSGTHTVTLATAGTIRFEGSAGSIINFTLDGQVVGVRLIAAGQLRVAYMHGTVTFA